VKKYLERFSHENRIRQDQVPPPEKVQDHLPGSSIDGPLRVGQQPSCISALLEGLNYLTNMRDPTGLPLPLPLLYDRMMGQSLPTMPYDRMDQRPEQQLMEEPRVESVTDQRSELSRLLRSSSSSNLLNKPFSNILKASPNLLETSLNLPESDNEEDEGMTVDSKPSRGPSLWRYKPAKRGGGWGSLFFKLLGGKKGEVTLPNIADYYDSRISKKENDKIMVRLPWRMGVFSPRLSKRTPVAPKEEANTEDPKLKNSPLKYLGGESSSHEHPDAPEGHLQNSGARDLSEPRARIKI